MPIAPAIPDYPNSKDSSRHADLWGVIGIYEHIGDVTPSMENRGCLPEGRTVNSSYCGKNLGWFLDPAVHITPGLIGRSSAPRSSRWARRRLHRHQENLQTGLALRA